MAPVAFRFEQSLMRSKMPGETPNMAGTARSLRVRKSGGCSHADI
jgi:hypothetical protein